jgi:hypothetical protein
MAVVLTSTFDATKTVASRRQRVDFTPVGGGSVVKISCRLMDIDPKLTTQTFKHPSATDDTNRDVAEIEIEAEDTITAVDVQEIDTIADALGGLNGLVLGTAMIYITDPRDATGKVRAIVAGGTKAAPVAFSCSLRKPDGAIRIGGTEFAKSSLLIRNLSGAKLVWAPGAAAPDTVT